jgi:long-subunit acyl-CoA synthetase (AMP-forming)
VVPLMDFGRVCRYWANRQPDTVAMRFDGVDVTWGHLHKLTDNLAVRLADLGVGPGGSVAVLASPSGECCQIMIAIMKLGACVLVFQPNLPAEQVGNALADRDCPVVVTDNERSIFLAPIQQRCPSIVEVRLGSDLTHPSTVSGDRLPRVDISGGAEAIVTYQASDGGVRGIALSHQDVLMLASGFLTEAADRSPELMFAPDEARFKGIC